MNLTSSRILLVGLGVGVPVLSLTASEMHPEGHPERRTQDHVVAWAESGAHQLWAGGAIGICSALLLLVLASVARERVEVWTASSVRAGIVEASMRLVAAVLAASGLMQFFAGVLATPDERVGADVVLVVLTVMQMHVLAAAYCLLAPAALAVAASRGAPRWWRVASAIVGVVLVATIALPPVSWAPGMVWLLTLGVAVAFPAQAETGGLTADPSPELAARP
jgi:hypothetical protein